MTTKLIITQVPQEPKGALTFGELQEQELFVVHEACEGLSGVVGIPLRKTSTARETGVGTTQRLDGKGVTICLHARTLIRRIASAELRIVLEAT